MKITRIKGTYGKIGIIELDGKICYVDSGISGYVCLDGCFNLGHPKRYNKISHNIIDGYIVEKGSKLEKLLSLEVGESIEMDVDRDRIEEELYFIETGIRN